MELKVNCVPVCSGMCSELDSQKVDNAVKLKRERSLRRVSEILIATLPRATKSQNIVCGYYVKAFITRGHRSLTNYNFPISALM